MLAIAISMLFGLAAFVALAVIYGSILCGTAHARRILAELAAEERARTAPVSRAWQPVPERLFAAA